MALRTVYVTAKRNQNLATIVINRGPTGPAADFAGGDITAETVNLHTAAFDTANGGPTALGEVAWDSTDGTLDLLVDGGVKVALGEDGLIRVRNTSGTTIPKGAPLVYLGTNGASTRLNVGAWIGSNVADVRIFLGFAAGEMADNTNGYATWFGKIKEIATDGGAENWDDGDILYAVPGVSSTLTNIKPTSGDYVTAAVVINAGSGTSGSLFVRPTFDSVPALGSIATFEGDQNLRTTDSPTFESVDLNGLILNPTTAPGSPSSGEIYLDQEVKRLKIFDGLAWQDFSPFNPLAIAPLIAYEAESSMLADGEVSAAQGDSISTLDDLTANSIDATQITATYQPIAYDAANGGPFARFDGSNDRMSFTLADSITNGTVFFATKKGSYAANLNLAAGTHNFDGNKITNNYEFLNDLVAFYLFDYALTESQIAQLKSYFVSKGAAADYGAVTNFASAWASCSSLTSFPLIDTSSGTIFYRAFDGCSSLENFPQIVTSSGTNFNQSWRNCSNLTSFPTIDTSLGIDFKYAWFNCSSLADFPEEFFDNWNPTSISNGVFNLTWDNCSLTSQSVENILTSIDTSGRWATTNGTSDGTPLGDPVIDIDYDGSGLTAATIAAIASLQSKGWGININP